MEFSDVERLAAGGESERVELKLSTGQRRDAARTLSACGTDGADPCCSESVATGEWWDRMWQTKHSKKSPLHVERLFARHTLLP